MDSEMSSLNALVSQTADTPKILIVDVFSTHCHPCMQMLKILPKLAEEIKDISVFVTVDFDLNPSLRTMYNVTKLPTFLFFKDGQEVDRIEGVTLMKNIKEKVETLSK